MELERNEAIVLKAIQDGDVYTVEEISSKTTLDYVAVAKAIEALKKQGLIRAQEREVEIRRLSKEGKKALEEGLVERKLVEELENSGGKKEMDEIKTRPKEVAVGWAIKRGLIKLEKKDGKREVVMTEKGKKCLGSVDELQEALKKVANEDSVKNDLLRILVSRGLIKLERRAERKYRITTKGKEEARRIKELKEEVTLLTPELIKSRGWKDVKLKKYDVSDPVRDVYPGKKQPYRAFLDEVKKKLVSMGFKEMTGPLIELEFWNFDALFQPQNHPARTWTDTYKLKYPKKGALPPKKLVKNVKRAHEDGWITGSRGWRYKWSEEIASQLMPRAHGTALSARTLASKPEIPGKYFAIARCYRPDVLDATHLIEFNQVEGIVLDENLNFRHLLGILKSFAEEVAGAEKIKFYPDYYPFTEPSVQMSAKHPEFGWVELGGAGIFREELTIPLGIDVPVIAWGLGIDRLAMFRLNIQDIRYLFSYDLKWLREQPVIIKL